MIPTGGTDGGFTAKNWNLQHDRHRIFQLVSVFDVPDTSDIPPVTGDHARGVLDRPSLGVLMVHINPE